jgi:hypothetical protein
VALNHVVSSQFLPLRDSLQPVEQAATRSLETTARLSSRRSLMGGDREAADGHAVFGVAHPRILANETDDRDSMEHFPPPWLIPGFGRVFRTRHAPQRDSVRVWHSHTQEKWMTIRDGVAMGVRIPPPGIVCL